MHATTTVRQRTRGRGRLGVLAAALSLPAFLLTTATALAQRIENPVAVFNGLDKITGRIVSFEVGIGETVQFGALQLTPRACYTRPATETPNTTAFLEVDEVSVDGRAERLFTGWVFAASPGLHGIEHPVYDIWLTDCAGTEPSHDTSAETPEAAPNGQADAVDPNAPPLPPVRPGRPQALDADDTFPADDMLQDPLAPIGE